MKTILVVDDEPKIVQLARDYLEHAGFAVTAAYDGAAAIASARADRPDLVVLDLGLPEIDGLDVARTLRADSGVPIVMLTGRSEESDKLVGLELGADDYITKPFSPKELVARVRAVLRRATRPRADADVIHVGDLVLDVPRLRTTVGGRVIDLTPTEFQLLATMAREPGGRRLGGGGTGGNGPRGGRENEPFPPRGRWGGPPSRAFMRRAAMFFVLVAVLSIGAATFLFWTLASALGSADIGGNVLRGGAILLLLFVLIL